MRSTQGRHGCVSACQQVPFRLPAVSRASSNFSFFRPDPESSCLLGKPWKSIPSPASSLDTGHRYCQLSLPCKTLSYLKSEHLQGQAAALHPPTFSSPLQVASNSVQGLPQQFQRTRDFSGFSRSLLLDSVQSLIGADLRHFYCCRQPAVGTAGSFNITFAFCY